jgi:glycogen debranching enzyme
MASSTYLFGVNDCKLASWTNTGSYGTVLDVASVQEATVEAVTVNAELTGDDVITDTHAVVTKAAVTLKHGLNKDLTLPTDVVATITGGTVSSTSGKTTIKFDADRAPFVGIAAAQNGTNGTGELILWVPKAKVMSGFMVKMAYGAYNVEELKFTGVKDGVQNIFRTIHNDPSAGISTFPVT